MSFIVEQSIMMCGKPQIMYVNHNDPISRNSFGMQSMDSYGFYENGDAALKCSPLQPQLLFSFFVVDGCS